MRGPRGSRCVDDAVTRHRRLCRQSSGRKLYGAGDELRLAALLAFDLLALHQLDLARGTGGTLWTASAGWTLGSCFSRRAFLAVFAVDRFRTFSARGTFRAFPAFFAFHNDHACSDSPDRAGGTVFCEPHVAFRARGEPR